MTKTGRRTNCKLLILCEKGRLYQKRGKLLKMLNESIFDILDICLQNPGVNVKMKKQLEGGCGDWSRHRKIINRRGRV